MESVGCAKWLGPDYQVTTSKVRSVAQGACATSSTSRFSEGCSATSSVSTETVAVEAAARSEAVGGSHWSSRREQHSREVPSRSPPRRSQQDEVATNSGTAGVLQEFSRTSTQAGSPSPSSQSSTGPSNKRQCTRKRWPTGNSDSRLSRPRERTHHLLQCLHWCPSCSKRSTLWWGSAMLSDPVQKKLEFTRIQTSGRGKVLTNVQDLEGWLSDRNCDLRNGMEFGDSSLMAKIGLLVGRGNPAGPFPCKIIRSPP